MGRGDNQRTVRLTDRDRALISAAGRFGLIANQTGVRLGWTTESSLRHRIADLRQAGLVTSVRMGGGAIVATRSGMAAVWLRLPVFTPVRAEAASVATAAHVAVTEEAAGRIAVSRRQAAAHTGHGPDCLCGVPEGLLLPTFADGGGGRWWPDLLVWPNASAAKDCAAPTAVVVDRGGALLVDAERILRAIAGAPSVAARWVCDDPRSASWARAAAVDVGLDGRLETLVMDDPPLTVVH